MLKNRKLRDGHIHSPYCPHGTADAMELYVKKAIELGLREMTFTEHMPLPNTLQKFDLPQDAAISLEQVKPYLNEIEQLKEKYKKKIKIYKGFEVDYIEGLEEETKKLLEQYGGEIEDSILSVHFLKLGEEYVCVDWSPNKFGEIITKCGGIDKVYDLYFETLLKSIKANLGEYKPRRIGHPTLVKIFQLRYPYTYKNHKLLDKIVKEIKTRGYEVDYNTAGFRKPLCRTSYPSSYLLDLLKHHHVKLVLGSDAHTATDVGRDFNKVY
ncbi:histidinol phosphatase [Sporanaerobium hydrogeniformans]|uniref:Histidinol phosphatase n=1 Tax=Sporanaerobium hydrogeniformans TaxID=3072179 RepID=A0AC61DAJ9_9FIRM|nr:histidinol-phosphatase HisJ [Sporanaerobium hydrogeniformans]PHV69803.1 histidinol phosphatase [Sporanaerobium hydrogeniformans]